MSLDALKEKCAEEGLALPPKPTRGLLMKMLRDNLPPSGEEKVTFGSHKGYKYKEVNWAYLNWAIKEVSSNPQHSPDLGRLARWAQAEKNKPPRGAPSGSGDPERLAISPVPQEALPKAKVKPVMSIKQPRTSRTRRIEEDSSSGFDLISDADQSVEDQIKDMESRLQVLRAVKKEEDKKKGEQA
jgi:hypothetical protein